jgi:hypothetical protein
MCFGVCCDDLVRIAGGIIQTTTGFAMATRQHPEAICFASSSSFPLFIVVSNRC